MRLKVPVICWFVVVLQGCSFSADQCSIDSDCPGEKICQLDGSVYLCVGSSGTPVPPNQTNSNGNNPSPNPQDCTEGCVKDVHEPNDTQGNAALVTLETLGCYHDSVQASEDTVWASLCADEDWYTIEVEPCRDRSFLLEIEINLPAACGLDTWEMVGDWDCEDPLVSCGESPFSKRARFLIEPIDHFPEESRPLAFGIRSKGLRSNYSIRITVAP